MNPGFLPSIPLLLPMDANWDSNIIPGVLIGPQRHGQARPTGSASQPNGSGPENQQWGGPTLREQVGYTARYRVDHFIHVLPSHGVPHYAPPPPYAFHQHHYPGGYTDQAFHQGYQNPFQQPFPSQNYADGDHHYQENYENVTDQHCESQQDGGSEEVFPARGISSMSLRVNDIFVPQSNANAVMRTGSKSILNHTGFNAVPLRPASV